MRIVTLSLIALAVLTTPAMSQGTTKVRPASEAEIRQTLTKARELEDGKNGYQYKPGGSIGYRISDGQICVLRMRKKSCVAVYSDGKRLETIDSRGNREFLN